LIDEGYLPITVYSFGKQKDEDEKEKYSAKMVEAAMQLKKGMNLTADSFEVKEGETSPPKRYSSGTLILAMENAGQLIEDEELRAQIKGSGIGTSATRAEIIKKLVGNKYLALNKKTQIITPTQLGEMVYETVAVSMKPMLNPALTASWEKGLTGVAMGEISEQEYMQKLDDFVTRRTNSVKGDNYEKKNYLMARYREIAEFYPAKNSNTKSSASKSSSAKTSKK
jgi:DNA topoisomerase-3